MVVEETISVSADVIATLVTLVTVSNALSISVEVARSTPSEVIVASRVSRNVEKTVCV